ncbi:MAG: thioredoxin domain-containing protein [Gemmatimonadales bacterium]
MAQQTGGLTQFYKWLAALALIGIGVIAWLVLRPTPVSIPANVVVTAADTTGFSGYYLGSDSAPVMITEYGDYQCPLCASWDGVQFPAVREQLINTGKLRWRYRDWPIDQLHRWTRVASHAAACAAEQGKYWQMHEALFVWQSTWAFSSHAPSLIHDYAVQAGIDGTKYDECMASKKYAGRIQASFNEGEAIGVDATPSFVIGGRLYAGVDHMSSDEIGKLVDSIIAARPKPTTTR